MLETVIANGKSRKTKVIFQPSRLIDVDLSSDFSMGTGYFMVKVNGTEPVELTVVYADEQEDNQITTSFQPGWNPDLIRLIKADALITNIQVGI